MGFGCQDLQRNLRPRHKKALCLQDLGFEDSGVNTLNETLQQSNEKISDTGCQLLLSIRGLSTAMKAVHVGAEQQLHHDFYYSTL